MLEVVRTRNSSAFSVNSECIASDIGSICSTSNIAYQSADLYPDGLTMIGNNTIQWRVDLTRWDCFGRQGREPGLNVTDMTSFRSCLGSYSDDNFSRSESDDAGPSQNEIIDYIDGPTTSQQPRSMNDSTSYNSGNLRVSDR